MSTGVKAPNQFTAAKPRPNGKNRSLPLEMVACNLCGSYEHTLLYPSTLGIREIPKVEAYRCTSFGYGKHHAIVRCRECGLVFANPRYQANELLDEYEAVEDP